MKRVTNITKNFEEAEELDIYQQVNKTTRERMEAAHTLREKIYGHKTVSLRQWKK